MGFSMPSSSSCSTIPSNIVRISPQIPPSFIRYPQFKYSGIKTSAGRGLLRCYAAAKQQRGGEPGVTKKKKKPSGKRKNIVEDDFEIDRSGGVEVRLSESQQPPYQPLPLPKPPAGFVLDDQGRVLMASNKRIATIVDSTNNFPLECVIRRVFRNSRGDECMLLCPVDTPVQILKSVNVEGWSAAKSVCDCILESGNPLHKVSDEEVDAILPTAAYALAKIHMHLVSSGFCYTARGGFCYTEDDIFDFHTDNGENIDGLPTEGIEIACFHLEGSHYIIYTPSDPLLFVAVKDENGTLQIADNELLEDPAITGAIDEETEFNALVEEEAAMLESLLGKR